ncbi:helix-turn-helix domain-containing protein [Nocardioides sp. W7]|uniref:winged helix-turn-helix transcriptional regulator n=1 Tax=Nocardioides sp. W7 TaxID=2931390 RepID=UPI001FD19DCE|nr:helix-turn-helix domain-containing protein [Nocardioides sp. W7]
MPERGHAEGRERGGQRGRGDEDPGGREAGHGGRAGVSEAVAAQRLRDLVEAGVLAKEPYREAGQRTRHEYVLTASGEALVPAVLALMAWGDRHLPTPSHVGLSHARCGEAVSVAPRCAAGHEVAEDELVVTDTRRT